MADDYSIQIDKMNDTISSLKKQQMDMEGLFLQLKKIIIEKLLGEGILGDTADKLAVTFLEEVIKPSMGFMDANLEFIKKNEIAQELALEASKKAQDIAEM